MKETATSEKTSETVEWSGEFQELQPVGPVVITSVVVFLAITIGLVIWWRNRR